MPQTSDYLALIPPQNANQPDFTAMVSAAVQPFVDLQNFFNSMVTGHFNLEAAGGDQLTILGLWVGITRYAWVELSNWFSFGVAGQGWGQGVWWNPWEPTSGSSYIDDDTFRLLIQAKIQWNKWDGATPSLFALLANLFAPWPVTIADNLNRSILVSVAGSPNATLQALAQNGLLPFSPVGVSVTYSFASQSLANQIYNDMGANEQLPYGVPSYFGWQAQALVGVGNNLAALNEPYIVWWCGLYPYGPNGNSTTNTLVEIRNVIICWLDSSTNTWTKNTLAWTDLSGDQYSADWSTDYSVLPDNWTQPTDGATAAFSVVNGRVAHVYGPYPRIFVNDVNNFGGMVSYCEARLTLKDPAGLDDRAQTQFVFDVGADPYPGATGPGIENNEGIVFGKFKVVTENWRSFAATSCTLNQLAAYPPPIDVTGILP
jgi:hypothetical protein